MSATNRPDGEIVAARPNAETGGAHSVGHGKVDRLRSLTINVTDLQRSVDFYTQVWGLTVAERRDQSVYLRAAGVEHHVLALNESERPGLVSVTFGTPDRASVDALHFALAEAGVTIEKPPREVPAPGGGYAFAFHDPEGRVFKVVAERTNHLHPDPSANRPVKLAHVVLNSADADETASWLTKHLGFRLSDQTKVMHFLRCNSDHHSIAIARGNANSLNHIAFEMATWDELMFGVGRLKEAGVPVQWGVGRHGPGDNVFAYFLDPDGLAIEYTAEVQQIDEMTHEAGTPEQWIRPLNRMDQWGYADLATSAIASAMSGASQVDRQPISQESA